MDMFTCSVSCTWNKHVICILFSPLTGSILCDLCDNSVFLDGTAM